jgi:hypothetical protein
MEEGPQNNKELLELMNSCWHCKRSKEEHANGKCLFASTNYKNYAETVYRGIDDILIGKLVIGPWPGGKP